MSKPYKTDFWDERYSREEYIYGIHPNEFFKEKINGLGKGRVILPAEGEGRNAVYAASIGWQVDCYDPSREGKEKAQKLADINEVNINYNIADHESWEPEAGIYDLAALIYTHCDPTIRKKLHEKVITSLKTGGLVLYEAFRKEQLELDTGGPKNIDMLLSKPIFETEFEDLEIQYLEEVDVKLHEGQYHKGLARVIRMIAKKK